MAQPKVYISQTLYCAVAREARAGTRARVVVASGGCLPSGACRGVESIVGVFPEIPNLAG